MRSVTEEKMESWMRERGEEEEEEASVAWRQEKQLPQKTHIDGWTREISMFVYLSVDVSDVI